MPDVLIVGAGPVGLFTALQLRARGRGVRIVDAGSGPSEFSKALVVMPRTMETLRIAGIAAPFEAAAYRMTAVQLFRNQQAVIRVDLEAKETWFDSVATLPQNVTEKILLDAFLAAGGDVEYRTELIALVDRPDGVTARLRTPAGEERASARFVVGCDGAYSTVRQLLGFGFEGGDDEAAFVVADVDLVGDVSASDATICIHDAGLLAILPISAKRKRIIATVAPDDAGDVTLDLVNAIIGERGPRDIGASKSYWLSRFRSRDRQAPGMHKGSIFLAGDAAHVHSPFGGQGMNAGLQDAANLVWKLDYALAGFATSALLPTYTAERLPVVREAIRAADLGTRIMTAKNPIVRGLRDMMLPNAIGARRVRDAFVAKVTGLATAYERSPIVDGNGRRAKDELVRVGDRERRLYDVLGHRYLLVYPATAPVTVAAAFERFASHYGGAIATISSDGDDGLPLVRLVRPDGYVALEATLSDDPTSALERLATVLATHVRRVVRA